MIGVVRAPAHLVLQDLGFVGFRKIGLPRAGAMDQDALIQGNSLVGNPKDEVALEWALSGGTLTFHCDARVAFTGASVHGRVGQKPLTVGKPISVAAGTVLEIDRFSTGRFAYLCISPAPDVPIVFGSRSTYTPAEIGGFHGRRLKTGDRITLRHSATAAPVSEPAPQRETGRSIRIVRGPQSDALQGRLLDYLLAHEFRVSTNSDRTGYRLDGPPLPLSGLAQILSEPACEGAIQITDSGLPIVLMADGPTIGGYNKVGVVVAADIGRLAQKNPGEKIRFSLIDP